MSTLITLLIAMMVFTVCATFGCLIASKIQKKKKQGVQTIELLPETDENQPVSTSEEKKTLPDKEGEYTGILHVSNGRFKFERPVMFKMYRNRYLFFEYDENGNMVLFHNKKLRDSIINMMEEHSYKCKNLKWYPISEK